jgi:hypothetical protein
MAEKGANVELPEPSVVETTVEVALEEEAKAGEKKKAAAAPIISAEEGIESLKEQVEKAKRDSQHRLAEKDRIIADAFKRASEAEREVSTVRKDQVGTIIDSLNKDKDTAKRDYRVAMEAGDFEKAADAQDRLSLSNSRIVEAERGRMALDEEVRKPLPVQQINDPVDQMAANLSPRSAEWVKSHPEYARDPRMTRQMARAHEDAIDEGHAPDTDGYFSYINAKLGIDSRGRQPEPRQERQEQPRESSRAPISAPVGRDVAQSPGAAKPGIVRLEPHEVQAAMDTLSPLYPKASKAELLRIYAQNMKDLMDEGKMARR